MRIVLDQPTIKPGRVTLHAENQSKSLVHEVIIGHDVGAKELPMDAKHSRVVESRVRPLGEIADLAPGRSGKLSLNLKPGTVVLLQSAGALSRRYVCQVNCRPMTPRYASIVQYRNELWSGAVESMQPQMRRMTVERT